MGRLSVQLNNNQPIKLPVGKGIVLKKINDGYSESTGRNKDLLDAEELEKIQKLE